MMLKLRTIFNITILGITGGIGGVAIGGLVSTYIIRSHYARPNTLRWYLGNFSTLCGAISGALLVPYNYLNAGK